MRIYVAGPLRPTDAIRQVLYLRNGYPNYDVLTDAQVVEYNVAMADLVGLAIFLRGHSPYVPNTMTQTWLTTHYGRCHDLKAVVKQMDFDWLHTCDALVLCPNWEVSQGARMEKAEMECQGGWVYHASVNDPFDTSPYAVHFKPALPTLRISEPTDASRQYVMTQRDIFSAQLRRRLFLGAAKYGESWQRGDMLGEAAAECLDLDNYAFLHRMSIDYREAERQGEPWPPENC
jgi:hypothetical protein